MLRKFYGFTMIELMMALVINVLLFGALLTAYLANINHYRETLETLRLNQQLQTVMNIMSNDIRRAGYWANAGSDVGLAQNNNPFMAVGTDLSISGNCILFAYDHNSDGTLPSVAGGIDDERYGFRLIGGAVQARPPGAAFNCAATQAAWENLTDPSLIEITVLTFTLDSTTLTTGPGTRGILLRNVDITLTGRLVNNNAITKTLTQRIRIRNDKFIP